MFQITFCSPFRPVHHHAESAQECVNNVAEKMASLMVFVEMDSVATVHEGRMSHRFWPRLFYFSTNNIFCLPFTMYTIKFISNTENFIIQVFISFLILNNDLNRIPHIQYLRIEFNISPSLTILIRLGLLKPKIWTLRSKLNTPSWNWDCIRDHISVCACVCLS